MKQEKRTGIAKTTVNAINILYGWSGSYDVKYEPFILIREFTISSVEANNYGNFDFFLMKGKDVKTQIVVTAYIDRESYDCIAYVETDFAIAVEFPNKLTVLNDNDLRILNEKLVSYLSECDDDGDETTLSYFGLELEREFDQQEEDDLRIENHNSKFI